MQNLPAISTNTDFYTHLGATYLAGLTRRLTIELKIYDAGFFDTTVTLETELHENNNILFPSTTSTNVTEQSFLQLM